MPKYICPKCGRTVTSVREGEFVCDHCGYAPIIKEKPKPECADALNCTWNQTTPCSKAVRDLFSNCPFKDWD